MTLEKKSGVTISKSFMSSPPPTHVVIDPNVEATSVASELGFDSPEKMAVQFAASAIYAVTPVWVLTSDNLHDDPSIDDLWGGYRRYQSAAATKPKVSNDERREALLVSVDIIRMCLAHEVFPLFW